MQIEQKYWSESAGWQPVSLPGPNFNADVVFLFGGKAVLQKHDLLKNLQAGYPGAIFCGCSTAGEIRDTSVSDNTLISTAVRFEHTRVHIAEINLNDVEHNSYRAGSRLAASLEKNNLVHVFVISDGQQINGSDLVKGLKDNLPENVNITGGLAGDGANFRETLVIGGNLPPQAGIVTALGFYGNRLKVGCGSCGGWDSFGPERLITRSHGNVLYQIDNQSALQLYKKYLGEHARGLPATGLLFPLNIKTENSEIELVRTILSVNEQEQSMTFAGDVPQGTFARFMKANYDRLIDGAVSAAKLSLINHPTTSPELAILISCVGRKLVLKQRVEEEVEGVKDVLGDGPVISGFYSYGELCPAVQGGKCELHNQTMTITTFSEV